MFLEKNICNDYINYITTESKRMQQNANKTLIEDRYNMTITNIWTH